ncbi:Cobalt transport protein cbiN [Syntrophobotulus glycolicus DSM 8271]|uniref:Cobalt transport protein CbiN n=1 Tax=Syntrophobotulus glycolicus (strain DSM 8271 / FlGlyR) TaxID=645991 RepID=F0SZ48_SYNGF|nr:energy-coupling factor ABC transporter substrate-binding protein [Syntrophobotulus glycolicus]ADY57166.1 Cobalt transport protein cbiN [Syntrophobotulus glycolicus DSM 8271]
MGTIEKKNKNVTLRNNLLLIALVVILAVVPIFLAKGAEFGGSDDQAEAAITEINPDYQPWFSSVWEPPSGEIESLLFALQAALGAGIVGYYLGFVRGRSKRESEKQ